MILPLRARAIAARPSLRRAAAGALAAAMAIAVLAPLEPAPAGAQPSESLLAYRMVDQWPQRDAAAEGLFQSPSDLDVARDGRVFIADPGIGGVHTLLPTGAFTTPFGVTGGAPAQLGQVGSIAVGPDPEAPGFPFGAERVYVVDTAAERVAIYGLDGTFRAAWEGIDAQGIAASMDGRVYVLDRDASQVRALDAATGAERFAFGERGLEDGQLANVTDVDVSPDGRVLAVGDKRGLRVQLWDLATDAALSGDSPPPPATLRRVYDLREARFALGDVPCDGSRVNALGADKVFIGQGEGACIVDGRDVAQAIAASANQKAICRATVALPRIKAASQAYYALAVSDPNSGSCGSKRTELDTTPVVVKYSDEALRQVATVWEAASNETADNPLLFAPNDLSMPAPDTLFVSDSSSQLRYFTLDGVQVATAERSSQAGNFTSDFEVLQVIRAAGSDVQGEIMGYYFSFKRVQGAFALEGGIGRFRTVERRGRTGVERVIEAVWTDPLISSFNEIEVPALAYNPVSGELLVVRTDIVEQLRTQDVRIVRYAPDGRELSPGIDLPDDGSVNPYVDLGIGPDGRIYALDDLGDVVRVMEADGTPVVTVPVAFDARSVAGGPPSPEGSVFTLREPGAIERRADDGRVTARLDGRPLPSSDPTTLTDLVVDGRGRVYVADGQSSLISVFEPTDDVQVLPVPDDAACLFRGDAAVVPGAIRLGEATTVTLTLDGTCGIDEPPTDIVVVAPYYQRLQQGVDPSRAQRNELAQLVSRLNFGKHRAGIVAYFTTVTEHLAPTADREAYLAAIGTIDRFDPPNADVKPRLRDAIEAATGLFDPDPSRRRVLVVLRADYCSVASEPQPGACAGFPPAEAAAEAARAAGATIIVVNSAPGAFDLATSDEDAIYGAENVHRRMVRYRPPDVLGTDLSLALTAASNMSVDPARMVPAGTWTPPVAEWRLAAVDRGRLRFELAVTPEEGGRWPVATGIVATLVDGWGTPRRVDFPLPEVEVASPTGLPPTATRTPSPVPTAAPTDAPQTAFVYLPYAAREHCVPREARFDVVLVVDVSSSMAGEKLAAAKASLAAFADILRLEPGADRVALVDFATEASRVQGLTGDRAALRAAIDGLATRSGTRIGRGLAEAARLLEEDGPARPGTGRVVVLLSDGRQGEDDPAFDPRAVAARLSDGATIFALGLGDDVDDALLTAIAGDPTRYLATPDADGLEALYRRVAASLGTGCP